jgi:hypothetical protein
MNDQDAVAHFHSGNFVGDHHRGASDLGVLDGLQHSSLVGGIQSGGALIENENFGGANESASDLDTLGLTARNQRGILSNRGLVPFREGHDEVMNVSRFGSLLNLCLRQSSGAVGDILTDRGVEQVRVLADHRDVITEVVDIDRSQSVWSNGDRSGSRLVESLEEGSDGGLSRAGRTNDRDAFSLADLQRDILED